MVNSRALLFTTLCSLLILSTFIDSTQSASCCLWYTRRRLHCHRLLGYTIQTINMSCDIKAVIFHNGNNFVCADPASSYTQKLMKCVDDKKKMIQHMMKEEIPKTSASS
ncbi:C-C motif chemokine 20b [Halichoeres trimaculatus]|uniref:C-C motif chemokine 20b n=1 Tax=Halichoeres trimaculatus TaxID=147232 RepID=UPI003D9F044D